MDIPHCSKCGKPFFKSLLEVKDDKLFCTPKEKRKSIPNTFIGKLYYRFTCEFGISSLNNTEQYIIEEKKYLEIKYDKNSLNTIELTINDESHTLANMIQDFIQKDPACTFCAYKVTHPSDKFVKLKVSSDNSKPVRHLVIDSLRSLSSEIKDLVEQIENH